MHTLASTLISNSDAATASLFLRWVARHGSEWPIDRVNFTGAVVDAYDEAVAVVGGGDGATTARTSWEWPDELESGSVGTIEVASPDPSVLVSASVDGVGATDDEGRVELGPGTYDIVLTAPSHETLQVSREILPGVATRLDVGLVPLLTASTETEVSARVVRISFGGDPEICTNGLLTDRGLVLTALSALSETTGLEVTTALGVFTGVQMVNADPDSDLAILRLDVDQVDPLPQASDVSDGQYVWGVFNEGCAGATSARTQLSGWDAAPSGPVELSPALAPEAGGGPLVDRTGAWVGLVTGPARVVPVSMAQELLELTIADLDTQLAAGGGGLPWALIGGAGAAGVAAAVLLTGGGGDGNGPQPTTGEIVLTIPGG